MLRLLLLLSICLFLPGEILLVGDSSEKVMSFEEFRIVLADTLFFHLFELLYTRQQVYLGREIYHHRRSEGVDKVK